MQTCESRPARLSAWRMSKTQPAMTPPTMTPEVITVENPSVSCDGASAIRAGAGFRPSALGHPRVFLQIDEHGYVDCGYCDRRFVLKCGPADGADHAQLTDLSAGAS